MEPTTEQQPTYPQLSLDELRRQLLGQRVTRPSFKWDFPTDRAEVLLAAAYQAEVIFRRRSYVEDNYVRENVARLAKYLTSDAAKFGVLLCGTPGNGKTTLLYAFQNATNWLNNKFNMPRPYDKGIRIMDAVEFAALSRNVERYREIVQLPMLALEDIGREAEQLKVFGDPITPVIDAIEYRYSRQLFTFVTTNLSNEQLQQKYGRRICDRFNELEIIIFNNRDSYRRL